MSRRLATIVLITIAIGVSHVASGAQATRWPLVLLTSAGDYPGETYTEGPVSPAEFVVFVGERLVVDVSVANWGREPATLDRSRVSTPLVTVARLGSTEVEATLRPLDQVWREGIETSGAVTPVLLLSIDPGDAMRWRLLLDEGLDAPGFYAVSSQFEALDNSGGPIRRQRPGYVIEVRDRASAEPAELARRDAEWLAAQGSPAAYAATETLARVYPASVVVHLIRGRLADAAGDEARSRREMATAAEILRRDLDVLFRRFARPGQIEDLIDSLRP